MNITLKNVPQDIYRVIKQNAKEHGRSLNSQIVQMFGMRGRRNPAAQVFGKASRDAEQLAASLTLMDDSTPLIRQDRGARRVAPRKAGPKLGTAPASVRIIDPMWAKPLTLAEKV